jgi:MFS family permease
MIELPICAGIPWLLLRDGETARPAAAAIDERLDLGVVKRAMRHPTFWLLGASYVSFALFYTALLFNLVPMLQERRFTTGEAVAVYALIGPAQVIGRIAMLILERMLTVTVAGLAGTLLPVLAMVLLGLSQPGAPAVFAMAAAFGAGMGIKTIVQATAAPEFLGREGYGTLQGAILMPVYAAQAVAPFAAALIWQAGGGYQPLERALLLCALLSAAAFALAALAAPRQRSR